MSKVGYKGLRVGMRSGYNPEFVYRAGWNHHPDPDLLSKEACGRGIHLCLRIIDVPSFVLALDQVWECRYKDTDVLGRDNTKVRVKSVRLLRQVSWASLRTLIDEYWASLQSLADEWGAKLRTRYEEYWAKHEAINNEYEPYDEWRARRRAINEEYAASLRALDEEWDARLMRIAFPSIRRNYANQPASQA